MGEEDRGTPLLTAAKRLCFYLDEMDLPSQRLALRGGRALISALTALGLLVGWLTGQFAHTALVVAGGVALALLLFAPGWPCFHRRGLAFRARPATER